MKDRLFYFVAILVFLGLVAFSLWPIFPKPQVFTVIKPINETFILKKEILNQIKPDKEIVFFPFINESSGKLGPRFSTRRVFDGQPIGAKFAFSGAMNSSFNGNIIEVIVKINLVSVNSAKKTAIGLYSGNKVKWIKTDLKENNSKIRFVFDGLDFKPEGLIIYPALEGENNGIEIQEIQIRPVSPELNLKL